MLAQLVLPWQASSAWAGEVDGAVKASSVAVVAAGLHGSLCSSVATSCQDLFPQAHVLACACSALLSICVCRQRFMKWGKGKGGGKAGV